MTTSSHGSPRLRSKPIQPEGLGPRLLTDGFAGYRGRDAALGEHLKHTPVVQDEPANAGAFFPIIHTLFSNIKAWLVGTHHGVSAKHLPRYLREWSYRFNRRNLPDGLDDPARCRMRHHHLRSTQGRHHARRGQPRPSASR
jgi:hypothetical protein